MRSARTRTPETALRQVLGGFSLIELLVAMTLGLLLTSGMISVFAGNRASSELNAAIANMQESARFALDAIATDTRSAGFQGCIGVQSGQTVIQAADAPTGDFMASAATGSVVDANDDWTPAPPLTFVEDDHTAVAGTHTISLQFGESDVYLLAEEMADGGGPTPNANLTLRRPMLAAAVGDLALISNCEQADLFAISQLKAGSTVLQHKAPYNTSGSLSNAYGNERTLSQTAVMLFRSNVYYVGDTQQDNEAGGDIRALYRQSLPFGEPDDNPPTELVTGVENLRVSFGMRLNDGSLRYVAADDAAFDATRVESIKIGLLMVSRDEVASMDDQKTYILAGQAVPPAAGPGDNTGATHPVDRRHRLVFNTTVKIRNRRFRS